MLAIQHKLKQNHLQALHHDLSHYIKISMNKLHFLPQN